MGMRTFDAADQRRRPSFGLSPWRKPYRIAAMAMIAAASACATQGAHHDQEWSAQGYLTPGPTSVPEVIGVYKTESECVEAGETWMSRQVVGNPVYADCLPVDRD